MRSASAYSAMLGIALCGLMLCSRNSRAAVPACDDFQARVFDDPAVNLPYRLYVPPGYDAAQTYPLVLALHGAGESGTDNCIQVSNQPGPLVFVSDTAESAYHAFMLAPQCPSGKQWVDTPWANGSYVLDNVPTSQCMSVVLKIVAALETEFSIDADRLYATGLSMGGFGTWDILLRQPGMFAAGVPMSGAGSPDSAALIKDVAIWNFHGDSDGIVPTQASRDMVSALRSQESAVIYREYPGGHSDWTTQYQTSCLVDWLFRQNRKYVPDSGGVSDEGVCPEGGLGGASSTDPRGGASAMGGASPAAGSANLGGTASGGAIGAGGSIIGNAGTFGTSGGASGTVSSGGVAAGAGTATVGSAGSAAVTSYASGGATDDSGGCSVAPQSSTAPGAWGLMIFGALIGLWRRRDDP